MSAKCICLGTLGGVHTIPLTAYIQETVGPEKEERKMIRQFQTSDTKQVMQLWFTGNENAHPFISRDYWRSHFAEVQEQLLQAEVFVYDKDGKIQGFIGMINEYIAGIFVEKNCRSCGIGKQLLDYAKERYDTLSLGVYQKNTRAVAFYLKEGFSVLTESVDEATGENEYTMFWEKKNTGKA